MNRSRCQCEISLDNLSIRARSRCTCLRMNKIAIVLLCCSGNLPAIATEVTWQPSARSMMRIEDNIRGASLEKESAWGFDTGGAVNLRARTETLTSEIVPRFNLRRFIIGDNLDADEYSITSTNDWVRERSALGLDFSYSRDSTLTSEATDAGRVDDVKNRDSIIVTPSVSYALTDVVSAQSSFTYNDVSYVDVGNSGLIDYTYLQGTAGLNYQWGEQLLFFANTSVSNFKAPETESTTRTYGGQTGATLTWDENLTLTAAIGWNSSDIKFVEQQVIVVADPFPRLALVSVKDEASSSGPIANVSIRKIFETTVMKFDYVRQVSPSGRGSQSNSDRVTLNVVTRLNDRLSLIFDGQYDSRTAEGATSGGAVLGGGAARDLNRDYAEVRGAIRYQIFEEWYLSAAYRFGHRTSTNLTNVDVADSNSVFLTVDYNGLRQDYWGGY